MPCQRFVTARLSAGLALLLLPLPCGAQTAAPARTVPPPQQALGPASDDANTPDEACLDAFQRELDYIHRTLRRLGAAPAEVEDLAQDVFLALRKSWSQYDAERPLRPYLFGIAFRLASAYQRKSRREIAFGVVEMDDVGPGPDDALQTKRARALILLALERIPIPRRAVLIMRDIDDIPVDQIAQTTTRTTGCHTSAFSRLQRKRNRFMERALTNGTERFTSSNVTDFDQVEDDSKK